MEALIFAHSLLRWVLLILLVPITIKSFISWFGKKPVMVLDRKLTSWTVISAHLNLVIGVILYAMKVKSYVKTPDGDYTDFVRFFKFEHISMMILAAVLLTIGSATSKRAKNEVAKHKRIAIFFFLALIIILAAIPWPFRDAFASKQWL